MNKLCDLNLGETAKVSKLCVEGAIRRRVQDIGLIEGTDIKCVLKSPLGDPKAYEIRGAVIAIRKDDAEKIYIVNNSQ